MPNEYTLALPDGTNATLVQDAPPTEKDFNNFLRSVGLPKPLSQNDADKISPYLPIGTQVKIQDGDKVRSVISAKGGRLQSFVPFEQRPELVNLLNQPDLTDAQRKEIYKSHVNEYYTKLGEDSGFGRSFLEHSYNSFINSNPIVSTLAAQEANPVYAPEGKAPIGAAQALPALQSRLTSIQNELSDRAKGKQPDPPPSRMEILADAALVAANTPGALDVEWGSQPTEVLQDQLSKTQKEIKDVRGIISEKRVPALINEARDSAAYYATEAQGGGQKIGALLGDLTTGGLTNPAMLVAPEAKGPLGLLRLAGFGAGLSQGVNQPNAVARGIQNEVSPVQSLEEGGLWAAQALGAKVVFRLLAPAAKALSVQLGLKKPIPAQSTPEQVQKIIQDNSENLTPEQQQIADAFNNSLTDLDRLRQSPKGLSLLNKQLGSQEVSSAKDAKIAEMAALTPIQRSIAATFAQLGEPTGEFPKPASLEDLHQQLQGESLAADQAARLQSKQPASDVSPLVEGIPQNPEDSLLVKNGKMGFAQAPMRSQISSPDLVPIYDSSGKLIFRYNPAPSPTLKIPVAEIGQLPQLKDAPTAQKANIQVQAALTALPAPEPQGEAPATFIGNQETPQGPALPLFNLTDDIPGHAKGSTLSGPMLEKLGYDLPEKPTNEGGETNAIKEGQQPTDHPVQPEGITSGAAVPENGIEAREADREQAGGGNRPEPVKEGEIRQHAVVGNPVLEVPLKDLKLSEDVPQFKADANDKGVVEPLQGSFDRRGVGPIQVWERLNGDKEIISGRHRFDLAERSGEKTIPAQIYRESDGFNATQAAILDAELNIRDNQGSTADYATYFRKSGITPEDAQARGLLGRAKGKAGASIGFGGSEDTFALHQAKKLTDDQAQAISETAPGDAGLQAVGIRAALDGRSADNASNMMQAARALVDQRKADGAQGDLFGFDDSALKEMEAQAKKATQVQNSLREQISAVKGAANKPELAKKLGVNVKNPKAVQAKIADLQEQLTRWQDWSLHPDLVAETKGEALAKETTPLKAIEPVPPQSSTNAGELFEDTPFNLSNGPEQADPARLLREKEASDESAKANESNQSKMFGDEPNKPPSFGRPGKVVVPESFSKGAQKLGDLGDSASDKIRETLDTLNDYRKKVANTFAAGDVRESMSASRDAADNEADRTAVIASNDIRGDLERAFKDSPKDLRENALTFVVEANHNPSALDRFTNQLAESDKASPKWKTKALDAIEFAKENYEALRPIADKYEGIQNDQLAQEQEIGQTTPYRQGYVFHAQDIDDPDGFASILKGGGDSAQFKAMRSYDTFADSIANGVDPKSINSTDLMRARISAGQKLLNKKAWVEGLKTLTDQTNGQPIITTVEKVTRPDGTTYQVPPRGYVTKLVGFEPMAVQKGYSAVFDALNNPSRFSEESFLPVLAKVNATGKSLALMLDTFHLARVAAWESIIKAAGTSPENIKAPIPSYKYGKLLMDYSPEEINNLAKDGTIPEKWLPGIKEAKGKVDSLVKNGLNISRIADAMHQEWVRAIPGLGKINKFIFEDFQRGAMTEVGILEYDRQMHMHPEFTADQAARAAAKDINTRFGNLGRQGFLKSATTRDYARLLFLAPQWNEGLLRSEVGGALGIPKAIKDTVVNRRLTAGLLTRSLVAMTVAQFAANQVVNLYTRGHPTWQNPEEGIGPKLSAWIPDTVGGGPGFFMNPLALSAEITHLLSKKIEADGNWPKAVESYVRSRSSVLGRPIWDILTQQDAYLKGIRPDEVLKQAAKDAVPLPIGAPAIYDAAKQTVTGQHSESFPGQYERQILQNFGLKVDSAPGQEQRLSALATGFNKTKGITPSAEFYQGDYKDLTTALRTKNSDDAATALTELAVKKTPDQIYNYFKNYALHPFTGSQTREQEFKDTLNPEQRQAYDIAVKHRADVAKAGLQLIAAQPDAPKEAQQAVDKFDQMLELQQASHAQELADTQKHDAINTLADKIKAAPIEQRQAILAQAIKSGQIPASTPLELRQSVTALTNRIMTGDKPLESKQLANLNAQNRASEMLKIISKTPQSQLPELFAQWDKDKLLSKDVVGEIVRQKQTAGKN